MTTAGTGERSGRAGAEQALAPSWAIRTQARHVTASLPHPSEAVSLRLVSGRRGGEKIRTELALECLRMLADSIGSDRARGAGVTCRELH